jgi:hypothetical protein
MRLLRFNTPILALIFGILIEAFYFAAFKLFGTVTEFGDMTNFWSRSFFYFHLPAVFVTDHCVTMGNGSTWQDVIGFVIFFPIAIFEWWVVFFASISFFRYFTRKAV